MTGLDVVGTAAMLRVGGYILVTGAEGLGWEIPANAIHAVTDLVAVVNFGGGVMVWAVDTLLSAILGFMVGSVLALIITAWQGCKKTMGA